MQPIKCSLCGARVMPDKLRQHHRTKRCRYNAQLLRAHQRGYIKCSRPQVLRALGIDVMTVEGFGNSYNTNTRAFAPSWACLLLEAMHSRFFKALDKPVQAFACLIRARDEQGFRDQIDAVIALGGVDALSALISSGEHTAEAYPPQCSASWVLGVRCMSVAAKRRHLSAASRFWSPESFLKPDTLDRAAEHAERMRHAEG